MKLKGIIIAAIVVVGLFLFTAAYVVDETEQVVVTPVSYTHLTLPTN